MAVLGAILAITRLWGLGTTPAEISAGEEAFSHVARQIELEGWLGLSHGILDGALTGYAYVLAIWTSLFGDDVGTVRLLSGVASLATLGLSFLLTSILFNRRAALFAMLLMAVSIWSLTYARLALPTSLLLLAEVAALYLLFRALYAATDESSRRTMLALSGALVGLGLYFDLAAVVFMVAVLCLWLRVYLSGTVSPRVLGVRFATFTIAVVIVSLPFWAAVASDELIRDEAKSLLVTESPRYLHSEGVMDQLRTVTGNVVNTGRALVWSTGSDEFRQGGGRIVGPLTGLLVLVGLLVCIRRGREDSFGALLVLLIVIVVGVGLTRQEGMFSRLIVAAPIALVLAGFAADWLLSWLKGRVPETGIVALIAVMAALVMWFNLTTYYAHPIGAEPTLWLGSVIE
ncbi:MAG: glycosyltransferase family 39 protein, partial [Chloroflexi bacterium]|nr:glycosyltransferase family 39 protein [Chloroflexota bacterium]